MTPKNDLKIVGKDERDMSTCQEIIATTMKKKPEIATGWDSWFLRCCVYHLNWRLAQPLVAIMVDP